MKVGLFSELQCPPDKSVPQAYDDLVEEAVIADQSGFGTYWLAELHFVRDFSVMAAPQLVAATMAAKTRRLRLGIAVFLLPVHHPLRLAEEAATLDILSDGRLDFGAGRGHPFTRVYEGFEVPASESRQRFDECLEIVRRAWTEPRLTYRGKFNSFDDFELLPKPLQKPHPPIYIGVGSPESFLSAGDKGYNLLCPAQVIPLPALKEMIAGYRERARGAGHPLASLRVAMLLPVFVAENQKEAESVPRTSFMRYYETAGRIGAEFIRRQGLSEQFKIYEGIGSFIGSMSYERLLRDHAVVGEPASVRERLAALGEEFGLDEIVAWVNMGGLDHEKIVSSMKLLGEKVIPYLVKI
jgi:alkanesulfonate monooxygenase SsuD/methylene tetrahydromethanopterin reductase-like flavin-dependent oxidoreductase (luciferase family)